MRVLIVEDELRMASLIRRGLAQEGLSVDVAISGEEALWMASATEYDAIVLDVMLPGTPSRIASRVSTWVRTTTS
jgi:two-component system OmpR family response regulator